MSVRVHQEWSTPAFDEAPVAAGVGPFVRRPLLRAWWDLRAGPGDRLGLVEGHGSLLPLYEGGGVLQFVGEADLVDYRSPLGDGVPELVTDFAAQLAPDTRFRLDSLPWDAADAVVKGLRNVGLGVEAVEHTSAAVLDLPADYDAYLAAIGKKERHELRRKRRRFEAQLGPPALETGLAPSALAEFIRLHRSADGEKGEFMTDEMADFFGALAGIPDARIDLLRDGDGRVSAAAFAFAEQGAYYLYNSAYDPEAAAASPGMVLLAMLIEQAVAEGRRVFDFLKGDEPYKYRLGARRRPLFEIRRLP